MKTIDKHAQTIYEVCKNVRVLIIIWRSLRKFNEP